MFYISDIIRKLMIDKRINVTDLSHKIGVQTSNLSRKLQNQTEDYKISYIQDIAAAMNCNIRIQIIDSESQQVLYTISDTNTDWYTIIKEKSKSQPVQYQLSLFDNYLLFDILYSVYHSILHLKPLFWRSNNS